MNGSICAYIEFYLLIFRRIEGPPPPRPLRHWKKRIPERVKRVVTYVLIVSFFYVSNFRSRTCLGLEQIWYQGNFQTYMDSFTFKLIKIRLLSCSTITPSLNFPQKFSVYSLGVAGIFCKNLLDPRVEEKVFYSISCRYFWQREVNQILRYYLIFARRAMLFSPLPSENVWKCYFYAWNWRNLLRFNFLRGGGNTFTTMPPPPSPLYGSDSGTIFMFLITGYYFRAKA